MVNDMSNPGANARDDDADLTDDEIEQMREDSQTSLGNDEDMFSGI